LGGLGPESAGHLRSTWTSMSWNPVWMPEVLLLAMPVPIQGSPLTRWLSRRNGTRRAANRSKAATVPDCPAGSASGPVGISSATVRTYGQISRGMSAGSCRYRQWIGGADGSGSLDVWTPGNSCPPDCYLSNAVPFIRAAFLLKEWPPVPGPNWPCLR